MANRINCLPRPEYPGPDVCLFGRMAHQTDDLLAGPPGIDPKDCVVRLNIPGGDTASAGDALQDCQNTTADKVFHCLQRVFKPKQSKLLSNWGNVDFIKAMPVAPGKAAQKTVLLRHVPPCLPSGFGRGRVDGKITLPEGYAFPTPVRLQSQDVSSSGPSVIEVLPLALVLPDAVCIGGHLYATGQGRLDVSRGLGKVNDRAGIGVFNLDRDFRGNTTFLRADMGFWRGAGIHHARRLKIPRMQGLRGGHWPRCLPGWHLAGRSALGEPHDPFHATRQC